MVLKLLEGDIVELKKPHPCGSKQWQILRLGADCRLKCLGCEHQVWLERVKLEKAITRFIERGAE